MTEFTFPIRVNVKTGERLAPSGIDPYEDTVWCRGSYDGRSDAFKEKYAHKISDLKGRLKALHDAREDVDGEAD